MEVIAVSAVLLFAWDMVLKKQLLPFSVKGENGTMTVANVLALSRPHTIIGTVSACTVGYVLMYMYSGMGSHAVASFCRIVASSVLANFFIVSVNQLTDVVSDRKNKKVLPIADGRMSWDHAYACTAIAFHASIVLAWLQSRQWGITVGFLCLVGYAYSVPPLRLKRNALTAALCIIVCRACIGSVGGALAYAEAFSVVLDADIFRQLLVFCFILCVLCSVIAAMKDVPDIAGDKDDKVDSFAVLVGQDRVCSFSLWLVSALYVAIIFILGESSLHSALHCAPLCWLHLEWKSITQTSSRDDVLHNYLNVIWPLFYFEFIAYPLPVALQIVKLDWYAQELSHVIWSATFVYTIPRLYMLWKTRRIAIPPEVSEDVAAVMAGIQKDIGVDLHATCSALGLPGKIGERATIVFLVGKALKVDKVKLALIARAAELVHAGMWLHTTWVGKSSDKKTKLAVLGGDWFLAKAVVSITEIEDSNIARSMARAIKDFVLCQERKERKETVLPRALESVAILAGLSDTLGLTTLADELAVGNTSRVLEVLDSNDVCTEALVRFATRLRL